MTFVITTGGIDLSVGSTVALVNALAAILLQAALPWPLVVLAMLVLGGAGGRAAGLVRRLGGHPVLHRHAGRPVDAARRGALADPGLLDPDQPRLLASSSSAAAGSWACRCRRCMAVLAAIAGWIALTPDRVRPLRRGGRRQHRGGAPRRHRRAGGSTLLVYVLTGMAAAVAGIIIAARLGSGSSNAAVGFELEVIAAVVLGGTALMGGRGTIVGTVLGALTIAVIGNGLILAHISPFFTQIVTGADHPGRRSG